MLSVAREMMTEPQLLLVDEPTAGLAPNLVEQVYDILLTAKQVERGRDPAGRAECRAGAAARRPSLSPQPRPGEGARAGPGIRQHARTGADPGMSAGLTKEWGAFVDWRRVALVAVAAGAAACRRAADHRRVRPARADHRRLLRDPGGELESARRLHRPVLAGAARLRGGRRLCVGPVDLSPEDAAGRQHSGRRPGGRARRLPARPARAAHAYDLSVDRHLGLRRDLSASCSPPPTSSPAAISA